MTANKSFQGSNCKSTKDSIKIDLIQSIRHFLVEIDSIHHRKIANGEINAIPNVVYSEEITLKRRLNLWSGICIIVGIIIGKRKKDNFISMMFF